MSQHCLIFLNDDGIDSSICSYLAATLMHGILITGFAWCNPFCVRWGGVILLRDEVPKVFLTPSLIVFELEVLLQV